MTPTLAQAAPPQPATETVSEPAAPELLWHYKPDGKVTTPASVSDGVVYFGSAVYDDGEFKDSFLHAVDAASGELLWRVRPGPASYFFTTLSMPHVTAGGVLYYVAGDGVRALDSESGALLWDNLSVEESTPTWNYALTAADGAVYVRSAYGDTDSLDTLDALDAAGGERLWRYSAELIITRSAPVFSGGKVYIDELNGIVTELDAATGEVSQRFPTSEVPPLIGSVFTVHEGILYVPSYDSHLYVIDTATGQLLWRTDVGGSLVSSLAVADGMVFVNSQSDDYLYAFDAATGSQLWRIAIASAATSTRSVAAGIIYAVSDDGYLYALKATSGELIWRYKKDGEEGFDRNPPTVADGVVHISSKDGSLYAFKAPNVTREEAAEQQSEPDKAAQNVSPDLLWRHKVDGAIVTPATVQADVVYVGAAAAQGMGFGKGQLYALDAASGELLWQRSPTPALGSSPIVEEAVIYYGSAASRLYALDATTGQPHWQETLVENPFIRRSYTPVAAAGTPYFLSGHGALDALDTATGKRLWRFNTGQSLFRTSPLYDDGLVYVDARGGVVVALNASTGELIRQFATSGQQIAKTSVHDGVLFLVSTDQQLYALDLGSAELLWRQHVGGALGSDLKVAGKVVYASSQSGAIHAFDAASGTPLWRFQTDEATFSALSVAAGTVYVGSRTGDLYALDAASGQLLWRYAIGGVGFSSPAVAGDVVYVGSNDGYLYALRAPQPAPSQAAEQ